MIKGQGLILARLGPGKNPVNGQSIGLSVGLSVVLSVGWSVGLLVCLSVVLFTAAAAAAIVDDNLPGFAINYVDI